MLEILKKFTDILGQIVGLIQTYFIPTIIVIFIFGLSTLFLPDSLFMAFQVQLLRMAYIQYIGFVTYFSFFVLLVYGCKKCLTFLQVDTRKRRSMQLLTPVEHEYLKKYLDNDTQTATFTLYDGVVAGLIEKGILYKANSLSNKASEQDFNINTWAYQYLIKQRDMTKKGR